MKYKIGFLDGRNEQDVLKDVCLNTVAGDIIHIMPSRHVTRVPELKMAVQDLCVQISVREAG